jgi:hypothetical protein
MELNQSQAINVLIQAARIGQSKGAYTLEDAELISKAIRIFIPKQEETDQALNAENQLEVVQ